MQLMLNIVGSVRLKLTWLAALASLLAWQSSAQQPPSIELQADTNQIRIGEQIILEIGVEADTTATVFFPDGQSFSPLETVEAFKTDTTRKSGRMYLQKKYALTQFDSGNYVIPTQRIEVDGVGYFTDSLLVSVATVPVDTVKQKMYDIKSMIEVDRNYAAIWKWGLLILLVFAIGAGLIYWFFIRQKPLSKEEKEALLPPYDRALLELKRLENSRYLIQDEYKKYYTELTDIVRSYLEEEVHVTALESTTSQLIEKLEMLKDAGQLRLDDTTLEQFRKILQTADLVKFARSKPSIQLAEEDRKSVELIVIKTKEALPEPTEEELLQQEAYQQELERKRRRKTYWTAAAAAAAVVVVAVSSAVVYYGFGYVRDSVLGHPTKELLEGEWIRSSYGFPPVLLTTPEVLLRQESSSATAPGVNESQQFLYETPDYWFQLGSSSLTMQQGAEPDIQKAAEEILAALEQRGVANIITKQEEFTTSNGVKGIKIYGSGSVKVPDSGESMKGQYTILLFGGQGFQQTVFMTWLDNDPYAEQIVDRIIETLEVKTEA